MRLNKRFYRKALKVYGLLYAAGSAAFALVKIFSGCPCGWIADCIDCGAIRGILESFMLWGATALVLLVPYMLLVLLLDLAFGLSEG